MRLHRWWRGVGAAAVLVAGGAWAQAPGGDDEAPPSEAEGRAEEARGKARDIWEEAKEDLRIRDRPLHLSARLAAGAAGFTGDLNDVTSVGPTLGVQVEGEGWNVVGVELGYEGSRHPVEADTGDPAVWRHNVGAIAKVGPPMLEVVKPYLGAGLGFSYLNANEDAEGPYRNDFLQEVPLVAGVDYRRGLLSAGVRGSFRVLLNDEFAERVAPEASGGLWGVSLNAGGRF